MCRAPLFVAVAVAVAVVSFTAVAQQPHGEPPIVAGENPWDPPTSFSAPSLCDIHDDLRRATRLALTQINLQSPSSTLTTDRTVAIAHAKGTAVLIRWMRLEYWMADARAQDPNFACYHWGFSQPEEDSDR